MRRLLALAAVPLVAACTVDRTNPYDPDGVVEPHVHVLQPYTISCGSWNSGGGSRPYPVGFDPDALSAEESDEISTICSGCSSQDDCDVFVVLTSQVREPRALCTEETNAISLSYLETLYVQDAERTADLVIPGASKDLLFPGPEEDGLSLIAAGGDSFAFATAYETVHEETGASVTTAAADRFRNDFLLTRPLFDVDQSLLTVTFKGGLGANRTTCRVDLSFDQATEVISHPYGWGGGYGRHVAIANLALPGQTIPGMSDLELATTYALGEGSCWIDVLYRDASGRLRHAETDGSNVDLEVMCDANGQPPPLGAGRFFDDGEGFVVPDLYNETPYIDFIGPEGDTPYGIGAPEYFVMTEFEGVPSVIAGVGDLISSSTDDVALVSPDGSTMSVCTTLGTCVPIAPPDCGGAPSRFVDVAEWPGEVELDQLLVATQSTSSTCVLWLDPGTPFTVAREEVFASVRPVKLQWATRSGVPSAILAGYVSPDQTTAILEMSALPAAPEPYPLYIDEAACEPAVADTSSGVGVSAVTEFVKECNPDGSGCSILSYRAIGLPTLDLVTYGGHLVPDAGALAYYSFGCADPLDAYYTLPLPELGQFPTSAGASLSARLDLPRARQASSTICQIPSTTLIGAPADGPMGGAGSMVVLYGSGDTFRTQPFCTPIVP